MIALLSTKGILFDLGSVLYIGSIPIEGPIEAIANIRANGIPCCFITNRLSLDAPLAENSSARILNP